MLTKREIIEKVVIGSLEMLAEALNQDDEILVAQYLLREMRSLDDTGINTVFKDYAEIAAEKYLRVRGDWSSSEDYERQLGALKQSILFDISAGKYHIEESVNHLRRAARGLLLNNGIKDLNLEKTA